LSYPRGGGKCPEGEMATGDTGGICPGGNVLQSLRHIDGIRGMLEASRLVNVEESLRTLRNQLVIEEQQAPRMVNGDASFRAPRTQSGKLKRCGTWSAPSDSPRPLCTSSIGIS